MSGPSYSDLANALAQIADQQAQNYSQQQQGGMGGVMAQGLQNLANQWRYYGGMGFQNNAQAYGRAPQILDNPQEVQWIQQALGGNYGSGHGGMLHTPTVHMQPDNSPTAAQMRALYNPYTGKMNSITGMPNGIDPMTGASYYRGGPQQPQQMPSPPQAQLGGAPQPYMPQTQVAQAPSSYFNTQDPNHANMIDTLYAISQAGGYGGDGQTSAADIFS